MSEKRSWDIQPSKRSSRSPQRSVDLRAEPVRRAPSPIRETSTGPAISRASMQKVTVTRDRLSRKKTQENDRAPVRTAERARESLKTKRARARKRSGIIFIVLFFLILIGALVCCWLPTFRIQEVEAAGPDSDGIKTLATSALSGSLDYVVPRNSILFFPEQSLRNQILDQYPDISAVSISRTSFHALTIASIPRDSAFFWCGTTYTTTATINDAQATLLDTQATSTTATLATSTPAAVPVTTTQNPTCYNADSQGFIFSQVSDALVAASGDTLRVYGALEASSTSPLGEHIANASSIPQALQFVKAIKSLGVPVVSLVIRGDEADLYAQSGTRITYVLGREQAAAELAQSAFPSLNLNDGSIQYVDLRFDGKVYYKKN